MPGRRQGRQEKEHERWTRLQCLSLRGSICLPSSIRFQCFMCTVCLAEGRVEPNKVRQRQSCPDRHTSRVRYEPRERHRKVESCRHAWVMTRSAQLSWAVAATLTSPSLLRKLSCRYYPRRASSSWQRHDSGYFLNAKTPKSNVTRPNG